VEKLMQGSLFPLTVSELSIVVSLSGALQNSPTCKDSYWLDSFVCRSDPSTIRLVLVNRYCVQWPKMDPVHIAVAHIVVDVALVGIGQQGVVVTAGTNIHFVVA
jgi:hypothetical protein